MFISLLVYLAATSTTTGTVPLTIPTSADITAPTVPILHLPQNNSTLTTPSPEFAWYQSTDPNGNTVIYTLYLDGVASFRDISNLGNSSSATYTTILEGNIIRLRPTYPLPDGRYSWYVTASDPSGNTSRSETWSFTISTVYPFLTATIAKLETRVPLAYLTLILLAIAMLLLLIFLWKRRYNLLLLNSQFRPLANTKIYHSRPPLKSSFYHLTSSDHGRLYLPHLNRYSTLTFITKDQTYVLSLSRKSPLYTIVLG